MEKLTHTHETEQNNSNSTPLETPNPTCEEQPHMNRRVSSRPKKMSADKIESDKSEAAFSKYKSEVKEGAITIHSSSTNLKDTSACTTTNSGTSPQETSVSDTLTQNSTSASAVNLNYSLNRNKALSKIAAACNRENFDYDFKDGSVLFTFSPAAFTIFVKHLLQFFTTTPQYRINPNHEIDRNGNIPKDTIRVFDPINSKNKYFTVNLYRTTFRVMVNGSKYLHFFNVDLPLLIKEIAQTGLILEMRNKTLKDCILQTSSNGVSSGENSEHITEPTNNDSTNVKALTNDLSSPSCSTQHMNTHHTISNNNTNIETQHNKPSNLTDPSSLTLLVDEYLQESPQCPSQYQSEEWHVSHPQIDGKPDIDEVGCYETVDTCASLDQPNNILIQSADDTRQ